MKATLPFSSLLSALFLSSDLMVGKPLSGVSTAPSSTIEGSFNILWASIGATAVPCESDYNQFKSLRSVKTWILLLINCIEQLAS